MIPAVTIWTSRSLYVPRGQQVRTNWGAFAARMRGAKPAAAKFSLARWAPVEFREGHRRLANVIHVYAVVLDVDDGTDLGSVVLALGEFYSLVHSTFSATPDEPRWRIIVPLGRPVNTDEYDRVWRWLAAKLEAKGVKPDYAARDASHAWAVPARPPSNYYIAETTSGPIAPVDEGLALFPAPPPPERTERRCEPRDDLAHRIERATKYLAMMPPAISGSGGHSVTFKAAVVLVRGFSLPEDEALRLLVEEYNPRCSPPWTTYDLKHKIRSAAQRGRLEPGWLADRPRDWRAA